jgi:C1A family cysteine protease
MATTPPSYRLSYQFQPKDTRDYMFQSTTPETPGTETPGTIVITTPKSQTVLTAKTTLPTLYRVPNLPTILDQGSVGDCVANAFAFTIAKQTQGYIKPSRLFHYCNSRILDNTALSDDAGTYIRTACTAIQKEGVCQETVWPYLAVKFNVFPPLEVYKASNKFKTFTYVFVAQDVNTLKTCLVTNQKPIVFGFLVYSSFMTQTVASGGQVPLPNTQTETLEGGHCMNLVGFNDTTQRFTCANSWGTRWGDKGYCYLPYAYLTNPQLASDFCYTTFVGF